MLINELSEKCPGYCMQRTFLENGAFLVIQCNAIWYGHHHRFLYIIRASIVGLEFLPQQNFACDTWEGGLIQHKWSYGDVSPTWVANLALWYIKTWYMNELIFQNFPKFKPRWGWLIHEWVTFSWQIGMCMGPLSNSQRHIPTKTKPEYPVGAKVTLHQSCSRA